MSPDCFLPYLDVAAPAVEVEVQVLDLAVLAKLVVYGLLVGLLVYVGDDDDPALDGAHGSRFAVGLHVVDFCLRRDGRDGLVDIHFYVGHCRLGVVVCWTLGEKRRERLVGLGDVRFGSARAAGLYCLMLTVCEGLESTGGAWV